MAKLILLRQIERHCEDISPAGVARTACSYTFEKSSGRFARHATRINCEGVKSLPAAWRWTGAFITEFNAADLTRASRAWSTVLWRTAR
jgi:hypothetical protein